jgi:hypothetical protein
MGGVAKLFRFADGTGAAGYQSRDQHFNRFSECHDEYRATG